MSKPECEFVAPRGLITTKGPGCASQSKGVMALVTLLVAFECTADCAWSSDDFGLQQGRGAGVVVVGANVVVTTADAGEQTRRRCQEGFSGAEGQSAGQSSFGQKPFLRSQGHCHCDS
mmetsp:Transcript_100576/g.174651  ORF Transcript_100576/g.174651 Transcript_100576/m.174651 type:complete len:118 (+) Transcript_100576:935-1288(+)